MKTEMKKYAKAHRLFKGWSGREGRKAGDVAQLISSYLACIKPWAHFSTSHKGMQICNLSTQGCGQEDGKFKLFKLRVIYIKPCPREKEMERGEGMGGREKGR